MKRKIKKIIKLYSFEIILFLLLLTGFFLLIVDIDLKKSIQKILIQIIHSLKEISVIITSNLSGGLKIIKFSNLLGFLLLFISLILTLKRFKARLLEQNYKLKNCEKCNNKLDRINKTNFLKFSEFVFRLKIRNYQCGICSIKYKSFKRK